VIIVGAGLSGIGAPILQRSSRQELCDSRTRRRSAAPGPVRYPGIRSDSDLHTTASLQAMGEREVDRRRASILRYIETRRENGIASTSASAQGHRWSGQARKPAGRPCSARGTNGEEFAWVLVVLCASGYYTTTTATAEFQGSERFAARSSTPDVARDSTTAQARRRYRQRRRRDARAAMSDEAAHVTMSSVPQLRDLRAREGPLATCSSECSRRAGYALTRRKNICFSAASMN